MAKIQLNGKKHALNQKSSLLGLLKKFKNNKFKSGDFNINFLKNFLEENKEKFNEPSK